jgi:hypothetical protein
VSCEKRSRITIEYSEMAQIHLKSMQGDLCDFQVGRRGPFPGMLCGSFVSPRGLVHSEFLRVPEDGRLSAAQSF